MSATSHQHPSLLLFLLQLLLLLSAAVLSSAQQTLDEQPQPEESEQPEQQEQQTNEQEPTKRLKHIYSLTDHCSPTSKRCTGFSYANQDEVAFFDLQTAVRIALDGASYDLGSEERLSDLTFENSSFANFPLHLFYALELSELDMRNCSVRQVSWESFLMANKLVVLLLSDNQIRQLEANTFGYASELQFLFLSGNRLRQLHEQSFQGLRKLQYLDLSDNRLNALPPGIFDDLAALQHIMLDENRLRVIDNDLFARCPRLLTVTLRSNRLRELGENVFRIPMAEADRGQGEKSNELWASLREPANQLLNVDVSHNQQLSVLILNMNARNLRACNCSLYRVNVYGSVMNVDLGDNQLMELYFSRSETLETLILRNNSLVQLAFLTGVPQLRDLNVADNPALNELPAGWQAPALEQLDISNTGHTSLLRISLQDMPSLRKLNISSNNLTEISPHAFEQLGQLTHFYFHANNWNCFNLNLVMDLLIKPHGISYTVDAYDPSFVGEYINGIACMYRLSEEEEQSEIDSAPESTERNQSLLDSQASASVEFAENSGSAKEKSTAVEEIAKLRQELRAVVQFFEEKFDRAFEQLDRLSEQMKSIERLNNTLWNQVTITV